VKQLLGRGPLLHDASVLCSDIAKHLSLPPVKLHCSMLAEDTIKAAVKDIKAKRRSPDQEPSLRGVARA